MLFKIVISLAAVLLADHSLYKKRVGDNVSDPSTIKITKYDQPKYLVEENPQNLIFKDLDNNATIEINSTHIILNQNNEIQVEKRANLGVYKLWIDVLESMIRNKNFEKKYCKNKNDLIMCLFWIDATQKVIVYKKNNINFSWIVEIDADGIKDRFLLVYK